MKQTETIHPPPPATPELGKFRGEPVYPRSSVVSLKTAENWMRNTGRVVIAGEQPMKMVKIRAGTVNRMRELEVLKDELKVAGQDGPNGQVGGSSSAVGEVMQGLYARSQTEPYVPDPVIDVGFNFLPSYSVLTNNDRGKFQRIISVILTCTCRLCCHKELRIFLVGSLFSKMVQEPKFLLHVIVKGTAKIARKLGFDYAEAVVRTFLPCCVTADFETTFPKFNDIQPYYMLHRLDLNSRNDGRFP